MLGEPLRHLLLDIRREHPGASVPLILRTLERSGRIDGALVKATTVRRLFVEHGLDRAHLCRPQEQPLRLRWEAAGPNALWHADVCHGPTLQIAGGAFPLRIHALLDDASRRVLAIWAVDNEREETMLLVEQLVAAARAREHVSLCGESGASKTCVLRATRQVLPPEHFRLTYCTNVTLGRRDFYRKFAQSLGLPPCGTAASLFNAISTQMQELAHNRIHPVLILDEAHLLHQDTLDHLHVLLNFDWDSRPLLSLVLVGLPELRDRLLLRRNRSLLSRIHHRLSLAPCTSADTAEYLRQRLRRVGCDKELFAPEAVTLLHEATGGTLREVDRLATWALCWAARKKRPVVDRPIMAQAVDAELSPPPAS